MSSRVNVGSGAWRNFLTGAVVWTGGRMTMGCLFLDKRQNNIKGNLVTKENFGVGKILILNASTKNVHRFLLIFHTMAINISRKNFQH